MRLTHFEPRPTSNPPRVDRVPPLRRAQEALTTCARVAKKNERRPSRLRQTTQIPVRWSLLTCGSLSDWGGPFKPPGLPDYSAFPWAFSHIKFYGPSIHLWTLFLSCASFPVKSVWQHIYFSDQNRFMFYRERINSDGSVLPLKNEWMKALFQTWVKKNKKKHSYK